MRVFILWWGILLAFWLLLPSQLSSAEVLAGVIASALAAGLVMLSRRDGLARFQASPAWLRHFTGLPLQVAKVSFTVLSALGQRAYGGLPVRGAFKRIRFEQGGDDPRSEARRALVTAGLSLPPNSYVVAMKKRAFRHYPSNDAFARAAQQPRSGVAAVSGWLIAASALLAGFVPCLWVAAGGQRVDAVVALQMASGLAVMILLLLTLAIQRTSFVDLALLLAIVSFPAGLLYAHCLERRL